MRIFAGVLRGGASNDNFPRFCGYSFGNFRIKASVIIWGVQSFVGFPVSPKYMTLSDLN